MIINFSNLGGGGGGGYTLPTATASRLGGVKIGSGVTVTADGTISVEGGGSDPNAQHWFTAETKSAAAQLSGLTEGDVVFIPAHSENKLPSSDDFYSKFIYWGWDFFSTVNQEFGTSINNGGGAVLTFTKIANPYVEDPQVVESMIVFSWDVEGTTHMSSIRYSSTDGWLYFEDEATDDPWSATWLSFSGDSLTFNFSASYSYNTYTYSNLQCMFAFSGNLYAETALTLSCLVSLDNETVQLNNGDLIDIASTDELNETKNELEQEINVVRTIKVEKSTAYVQSESDLNGYTDGWIDVTLNEQDTWVHKGGYLKTSWYDETQQTDVRIVKRIAEIPTSSDVLKIVKLTQDEYDNLGTYDDTALYVIIPDPNA